MLLVSHDNAALTGYSVDEVIPVLCYVMHSSKAHGMHDATSICIASSMCAHCNMLEGVFSRLHIVLLPWQ